MPQAGALDRLRRLPPTSLAHHLTAEGRAIGETETLDVTVVMSDVRGYTSIAEHAEHADPAVLAQQLTVIAPRRIVQFCRREALTERPEVFEQLDSHLVKGRATPVVPHRLPSQTTGPTSQLALGEAPT